MRKEGDVGLTSGFSKQCAGCNWCANGDRLRNHACKLGVQAY